MARESRLPMLCHVVYTHRVMYTYMHSHFMFNIGYGLCCSTPYKWIQNINKISRRWTYTISGDYKIGVWNHNDWMTDWLTETEWNVILLLLLLKLHYPTSAEIALSNFQSDENRITQQQNKTGINRKNRSEKNGKSFSCTIIQKNVLDSFFCHHKTKVLYLPSPIQCLTFCI